jgi:hypothetical protein
MDGRRAPDRRGLCRQDGSRAECSGEHVERADEDRQASLGADMPCNGGKERPPRLQRRRGFWQQRLHPVEVENMECLRCAAKEMMMGRTHMAVGVLKVRNTHTNLAGQNETDPIFGKEQMAHGGHPFRQMGLQPGHLRGLVCRCRVRAGQLRDGGQPAFPAPAPQDFVATAIAPDQRRRSRSVPAIERPDAIAQRRDCNGNNR